MKGLFWASTLLVMSAIPSLPAQAAPDCDYVSYAINRYGQCVDLSSFTKLGALDRKIADLRRQINPIVLQNLRLEEIEDTDYSNIVGIAYNQSRRPIRKALATLRFTRMIDGDLKSLGSEQIVVNEVIPVGRSVPVKWLLKSKGLEGASVVVDNVQVLEMS